KREAFHSSRVPLFLYSGGTRLTGGRRAIVTSGEGAMRTRSDAKVRPVWSLEEFFRNSVSSALDRQGLSVDDHTAYYVVNLLTLFARSEVLYEGAGEGRSLKPLALILAEAMDARTPEER